MFCVKLKNISKDYHLFIDGEQVDFKLYNTTAIFSADLCKGKHKVQIKKTNTSKAFGEVFIQYLFSSLLSSYDENVVAAKGYHKIIDIIFEIDLMNENSKVIFDGESNKIVFCSEKYIVIYEDLKEDLSRRKKVRKYITWPIIVWILLLLVPLIILSVFMMIASFDMPSLLLFVITSTLLFLFLLKIKDMFK